MATEFQPFGAPRLLGTLVKPKKFKCGGWTGCDEDHEFFEPKDVLVLNEAMPLDEMRETHHWNEEAVLRSVARGTLYIGPTLCIPTLLGEMWESCSVN